MAAGRMLGIDFGERRVGVAISDELGLAAHPLATLDAQPESDLLSRLVDLTESEGVAGIVVGIPISLSGERGPAAQRVEEFVKKLRAAVGVPVETIDERLTTKIAEKSLGEAGLDSRQSRKRVDKVAAALILEDYLRLTRASEETEAIPNGEEPDER